MGRSTARALAWLAWLNVAAHVLGLGFAWVYLRHGTVLAPLADRMTYLSEAPAGWALGWGIWMACALLLVAYLFVLRQLLPERSGRSEIALVAAAAGMGVDLSCDLFQMAFLPLAAVEGQAPLFGRLSVLTFVGGATVANGLYTLAVLLMERSLETAGRTDTAIRVSGYGTVLFGFLMAAAGILLSPRLFQISTAPTIVGFSFWAVLVARKLNRGGSS